MNRLIYHHQFQASGCRRQSGAVLFFVLIALVVLMLAGTALVRSVDTATIISGNLVFRQAATVAGDRGMKTAVTWLANTTSANPAATNNDNAAQGYYSSNTGIADLMDSGTWTDGKSVVVRPNPNLDSTIDASGNEVRYVIERMCRTAGTAPTQANCLWGPSPPSNNSKSAGELQPEHSYNSPIFRITARVTGPKNTVSYIQGFVY